MAESGSLDFDLLWYLEKLNKREFQSSKNHLGQACVEIGLPPIPRLDLRKTRPDLVDLLTVSYEVQHIWNIMYSIFHKINRDNLCEKINASEKDLRCVGLTRADVSTLQTLKILLPSSNHKDHYTFIHLKIQEFCAAIAYMMKLRLSIQCIFENKKPNVMLTSSKMKSLVYWRDICNLLHTRENLQELEICNSELDDTSERVLCKALRHPSCQLRTLKLTYLSVGTTFEDVFKAIVYNQNLTILSLNCMPISLKMFSLLHEVLESSMCSIQHLSLTKCDLETHACKEIASLLISSKLKKLTLSKNPLKNNGVKILCDALLHPDCGLESLVLSGCFFTNDVCQHIASAMINNPNFRSLELGSNNIGDSGMEVLCNALKHPSCKLENIGLEECMLTSACYASLTFVLKSSKTLKKLNLLGNKLGDEGIVKLLESLGHPDCILQTVGLQINDMDVETMKLLLTVKKKNTKLVFISQSWAKKEGREVSSKLGHLSLPQSIPMVPNLTWHLISRHMPRKSLDS
ncbi:NACHT, LRR and PYD domains-containing protein 11 [Pteropus alecto]|uniref:NACHT, LRR and PYD domains-containing protein 11 n=1 Tax=Pteropus alecto TaxID=9402 RepID=L5KCS3_PTEAL|nr:NACHT, LRR and PYD domains-containing protein 11 [Pteropus alecto]